MESLTLRPIAPEDHAEILRVVSQMRDWFDEDAVTRAMPADLRHQYGIIAELSGEFAGFLTLYVAEGRLHIAWLAVHPMFRRKGIGRSLINAAEAKAREMGLSELATYTLGASVDYPPYVPTRRFYEAMGFRPHIRKKTDNPGCPEELHLIKLCRG